MLCEKEKAPARVAALAEAWKDDFAVNHSAIDSIMDSRKTLQIFELLHVGAENALTLRELGQADSVGLSAWLFPSSVRAGSTAVYSLHERESR